MMEALILIDVQKGFLKNNLQFVYTTLNYKYTVTY